MAVSCRVALLAILDTTLAALPAFAANDHVSVGGDVTVAAGETSGDVVCIFCNVNVRGNIDGDVVTIFGGVTVDGAQWVTGDMVALGGDVSLAGTSSIHGDLVVLAGDLQMSPSATVNGDRKVVPGRAWLLLPFAPLLIFGGFILLIVYFVQRQRYRFPMYPQGRGF